VKRVRHSRGPRRGRSGSGRAVLGGILPTILLGVLSYAYVIGEATAAVHQLLMASATRSGASFIGK
jgi:hypothetical protein